MVLVMECYCAGGPE